MVLLVAIASCKPEIKPIGERYLAGEGVTGSWELTEVQTTDITLPVPETRDQSRMLNDMANRMQVTIKEDGTYTVDQLGIAPNIFGAEGLWQFDQVEYPTMIYFIPTNFSPPAGDTLKAGLLNMPRTIDNNFGFSFTRNRCDKDYVSLEYTFNRK